MEEERLVQHNQQQNHEKHGHIHVALGYKEELLKGMNTFMSFTLSLTNSAVITSIFVQLNYGFQTGGPVVMLYGWLIVGIFTVCVSLSMGEICSTYPASGSVYYWSGALSNKRWAPVVSYFVGWIYFLGNIAMSTSFAYWLPTVLSGVNSLATGKSWSTGLNVVVCILILAIWAGKGLLRIDYQGYLHDIAGIFQLVSAVAIITVIFVMAPSYSSSSFVFTEFYNSTGFESNWYVCYIGLLFSTYTFVGYEAAGTCAEETIDSTKAAPKGIVYNVLLSFVSGTLLILAILYGCNENIEFLLDGNDATVNLFSLIFNSKSKGVIFMVMLLFMGTFLNSFTCITVASRIVFAMVRDGAIPYSRYFYYINPSRKSPDRIIALLFILESILCLLPLISEEAFTAINQLATICLQITYLVPILLRLTVARDTFQQGDFNLGKYSIPIGWCSAIFLIVSSISLLTPTEIDPVNGITVDNFNFTPVILIGVLIIAFVYWNLPKPYGAKHFFQGPKRPDITFEDDGIHITDTIHQKLNYDTIKNKE